MVLRYGRKKHPSRRKQTRRRPRMSFKTRVLRAMEGEKKVAKLYQQLPLTNQMNTPIQLMPDIKQGTSQHAQRVGNEISLKKLICKGFIRIPSTVQVAGDTEYLARLLFLRQRNINASTIIDNPGFFEVNNLMDYNQPYLGTPNNYLQKVNAGAFIARKDLKKHLSVSANFQGTDTEVPNPDSIFFFSYTITFGKQGKTLNYKTDTDLSSMGFPYFLCAAIHQTDGSLTAGVSDMELYTEAVYTDV